MKSTGLPRASNARARCSPESPMELNDLYRDVILDHNRRPRNFGGLDSADASVEGFNPMCGDHLTLRLKLADDTISDIRFEGQGCAISTASASLDDRGGQGQNARRSACSCSIACISCSPTMRRRAAENWANSRPCPACGEYPARVKCASPVLAHAASRRCNQRGPEVRARGVHRMSS